MAQPPSASFGPLERGVQVGQNYGSISTTFQVPPDRPETPPQPSAAIPFCRDPDFVDRADILDRIHQRCCEPAGRVALVGLGGIGKSQLAIEYAYRIAAEQVDRWVFWVHAGTRARVEEGFRTIADAAKLAGRNRPDADIPQLVYSWLSSEQNGRWVMILDSADDGDVFYKTGSDRETPLASCLAQSRNGCILVTTRNKDLARRLTGSKNVIEVGPMTQTDALLLLEKRLGSISDDKAGEELVQALDCVPLAISQAGAYIQAEGPRISVPKYLAKFRDSERRKAWLLGHDTGDLRRDGGASNAILTTWQISFESIRSKRPSAADVLSLMSFFDRQGIPEWLLKPPKDFRAGDGTRPVSDGFEDTESNSSAGEAEDYFDDDVSMLRDYCLIASNEGGVEFEMHGLVQLSTRKWLEAFGRHEEFKQQFVARLGGSFPTGDYSNWPMCRRLFAHVEKAIDYQPASDKVEEMWATLLFNGAWYAWLQGRYDVAGRMTGKARRSRERRLGKEDVATLWSTSLLASVLRDRGLWKEAEELQVQVMETSTTKLGADHPDTLTSISNLAFTWRDQGRYEDAIALMWSCAQARQRVLGPNHSDTLSSLATFDAWSS